MKKIIKRLKITAIDVLIYKMDHYVAYQHLEFKYSIEKSRFKDRWRYVIKDGDTLVHQSHLHERVFLLKSVHKKGPVIGDCFTNETYRGQSIYPFVINTIAKEVLETNAKEVFVIVNRDNINSIKGIEKAGFVIFASIKGKRWLWFYPEKQLNYYK